MDGWRRTQIDHLNWTNQQQPHTLDTHPPSPFQHRKILQVTPPHRTISSLLPLTHTTYYCYTLCRVAGWLAGWPRWKQASGAPAPLLYAVHVNILWNLVGKHSKTYEFRVPLVIAHLPRVPKICTRLGHTFAGLIPQLLRGFFYFSPRDTTTPLHTCKILFTLIEVKRETRDLPERNIGGGELVSVICCLQLAWLQPE